MNVFKVVKPGLFTTVQDLGRYGYLKYGVPISGAMDTFSLIAANLLVDNPANSACLEITLIGPEIQALTKTHIAVTGGETSVNINEEKASMWQTIKVQEGDVISFGKIEKGCRAYVSIKGGINVPPVLGSRSTYVRGAFGGINGRQLCSGDLIHGFPTLSLNHGYAMPEELVPKYTNFYEAHVILGPQSNMFTEKGLETFLTNEYTVTSEADRMGYRLEGTNIEHKDKGEIISDALLPGAVQVPPNGKPIIIMRDAQTTGGYPKIAVVITPDISLLGQAKPGDAIKFSKITTNEAQKKTIAYYTLLSNLRNMLIRTW